jgi:hypothetical protein
VCILLFYVCFQLGPKKVIPLSLIEEKWQELSLPKEQFDELVQVGSYGGDVEWLKFFSLAASGLGEVSCWFHLKLTVASH